MLPPFSGKAWLKTATVDDEYCNCNCNSMFERFVTPGGPQVPIARLGTPRNCNCNNCKLLVGLVITLKIY